LHDRFLRLFLEHEESLRVFVSSLLFGEEEEREVMQDVAIVLWRKFDGEMESLAFRRWAFGVARMEVLSFRRDRARDRHCFGDRVYEVLAETVLEHSDTFEEERHALDFCLKRLPEKQLELVEKAYAPGARIDHLADKLGRTAMSLYKSLHRIRLTLMDCTRKALASDELI
jgi:RNA polymerase sigma-70 factor (ECF subfamily)